MSIQLHIPGYTLVGKIAEGGMATVWRARQDKLDRVVAIKVLMKQLDADEQEYERFIYEARAAASLIHPNIVQVIDAGERDGFLYYVMEYVPGPTAGDMVEEGEPMPEAQVLQIAQEVSEAMDYAWRDHRVVHCDIKPDNLLLHRNGRTKIADLGLAQVLGAEGIAIEDDMTLGTPNYFPPEQALVEDGLDCRADMYALGATLYHLGTGAVPFGEMTPEETASEQVHGQLINPKELNPKLSWGFCCLVERLMAKDPLHRYEDWTGVMADILSVKEGHLIQSPLASNIRSTVVHTQVPAGTLNEAGSKKVVRVAGARRRKATVRHRGGRGSSGRGKVTVPRRSGGRSKGAVPPRRAASPSIWSTVVGLGLVAGLLYLFTLSQSL